MKIEHICVIRWSKPSGVYIMNFYRPKYVTCKKTESGRHMRWPQDKGAHPGRVGTPSTLVVASCPSRITSCFPKFLNIPKRRKIAIRIVLESVYLRTTYLFLFGVWNVLESIAYVFLRGYGFNNISFNIDRIIVDVVFNSLTFHHPQTCAFEVVDFYGTA